MKLAPRRHIKSELVFSPPTQLISGAIGVHAPVKFRGVRNVSVSTGFSQTHYKEHVVINANPQFVDCLISKPSIMKQGCKQSHSIE